VALLHLCDQAPPQTARNLIRGVAAEAGKAEVQQVIDDAENMPV
jgi:hypothetical protein